jgi:hypothetical protein
MSLTERPVAGAETFGSIPLAGGALTGATQTTQDDGRSLVLLTISPSGETATIEASIAPGASSVRRDVDGPSLLTLRLPDRDPHLVITVTALTSDGDPIAQARVAPFVQDPLDCHTVPRLVGGSRAAEPTYMAHLDAFLAAPVLPACTP